MLYYYCKAQISSLNVKLNTLKRLFIFTILVSKTAGENKVEYNTLRYNNQMPQEMGSIPA